MKSFSKIIRQPLLGLFGFAALIAFGSAEQASAQDRDPFAKPVVRVKQPKPGAGETGKIKKEKPVPVAPTVVAAPPIQQRIENYKVLRLRAIEAGVPVPKPTTVLTLDEMQVLGIFRTPRGAAVMVEATPIKLTYTIYPGEKFYDGQLVAIEEQRAVFRRDVRMSDGKVMTAAENKGLKVPTLNEMSVPHVETASNAQTPINPTATIPAASVPSGVPAEAVAAPAEKTETASSDSKLSMPVATEETTAPASDKPKKGASSVNPRKSGKTTVKN